MRQAITLAATPILITIAMIILLASCAPRSAWNNGRAEYVWTGYKNVCVNPAYDGSTAFGPFGTFTNFTLFKQVNKDGTVSPQATDVCE